MRKYRFFVCQSHRPLKTPLKNSAKSNKNLLCQLLLDWHHILFRQIGPQQPHPTINIESDTAGRHHSLRIGHVKGGHIPDGETCHELFVFCLCWHGELTVAVLIRKLTAMNSTSYLTCPSRLILNRFVWPSKKLLSKNIQTRILLDFLRLFRCNFFKTEILK